MIGEKRWKNKVVKHLIFRADSREEGDFSRSIGRAISGQDNGSLGEFVLSKRFLLNTLHLLFLQQMIK